jgi:hypothetical protein
MMDGSFAVGYNPTVGSADRVFAQIDRNTVWMKGRAAMKKMIPVVILGLVLCGCSGKFWGGLAGGAAGTATGYELKARQQIKALDDDLANKRIDQKEYDIRKSQIERGSLVY